jgi:hypothetical protein
MGSISSTVSESASSEFASPRLWCTTFSSTQLVWLRAMKFSELSLAQPAQPGYNFCVNETNTVRLIDITHMSDEELTALLGLEGVDDDEEDED